MAEGVTAVYATERDDGWWDLESRYDATVVNAIRQVPHGGRVWDKDAKLWSVRDVHWPSLVVALRILGHTVYETPSNRIEVPHATGTWAELMFDSIPERLHAAAWKALQKALHPDIGGDPTAAQVLNDAYGALRKRAS